MKLNYIFSQLETSELKQLNCIDPVTGKIKADQYQGIVDVMNQGLVDLHTRFDLRIGRVEVPIDPTVALYDMSKFDPQVRGRFLQLHKVTDECGRDVRVNDFTNCSLSFRSPLVFEVPEHMRTVYPLRHVVILYRSLPTKIGDCFGDIDPEMLDVDVPMAYVWALCLYVASRLHTPVGLTDGTYRVNAFLGLFQAECTRLEDAGMDMDFQRDLGEIRRGGWA
jgi:hypothetical protein